MNLERSTAKLWDIVRRIRARLTFAGVITLALGGLIVILILLLFVDALVFSRFASAPGAPAAEIASRAPSISRAEIAAAREILQQRRGNLDRILSSPPALPNPFR